MKKSLMESLFNIINNGAVITDEVKTDFNAEYDRTTEKSRANRIMYEAAKDVAAAVLTDTPMTAKEVFAATDEWPENMTANKVQYALNNYWEGDISERHDNGKNPYTYTKKSSRP